MKFLAIDTVFDQCSVAIMVDGKIVYADEQTGKRQQTQQILPMIDAALQNTGIPLTELSALVFNRGPGAFSSIRINTAVVQGLSFAHNIPCIGVSSLQVLAQAGYDLIQIDDAIQATFNKTGQTLYAVMDARMQQLYVGQFSLQNGMLQATNEEHLLDYQSMTPTADLIISANSLSANSLDLNNLDLNRLDSSSLDSHTEALLTLQPKQAFIDNVTPTAATLAKLGAHLYQQQPQSAVPAAQALPVYLRNNAWKTLKEQKQARAAAGGND